MYLIDGNNLIGHTKALSQKDPQARQELIDRIIPFLELSRRQAHVVFDGPASPLRKSRRIQVIFSGHKATADDRIRSMVETARAPKQICVVSSDNAVYGYSKSCGAQAIKCHEFNRLLHEARDHSDSNENRDIKIDDLKAWLRYFGEEE